MEPRFFRMPPESRLLDDMETYITLDYSRADSRTEINARIASRVDTLRLGRQWPLPDPGTTSSSSPHQNVLSELSRALTFLQMFVEDPTSDILRQELRAQMRMLFSQLSGLRYPYRLRALLLSIGEENENEYEHEHEHEHEHVWDGMLHEALESVHFLMGDAPSGFFFGQLPIKIRELKQSISRIYIYVACCNQEASTFRDCLSNSDSSREPIDSYLLKLLNTLKTHYSGAWSDSESAILRQLAFMEAVLLSPRSGNTLSRMSDDSEAPIYLWDDIEAAIFTALDVVIGLASSWSYPEEPVNTAVQFISLAIYTQIRILKEKGERGSNSKETVVPFRHWIMGCGISLQKWKIGSKLSWLDEIGVQFWDCILNSMLKILQQSSLCWFIGRTKMKFLT